MFNGDEGREGELENKKQDLRLAKLLHSESIVCIFVNHFS